MKALTRYQIHKFDHKFDALAITRQSHLLLVSVVNMTFFHAIHTVQWLKVNELVEYKRTCLLVSRRKVSGFRLTLRINFRKQIIAQHSGRFCNTNLSIFLLLSLSRRIKVLRILYRGIGYSSKIVKSSNLAK